MRIHRLQTGTVTVKHAHRALRGHPRLRFARIFLGRVYTSALPINTWLIEHPEGLIVVDTGELAAASQPEFFHNDRDYRLLVRYARAFRFAVTPAQELAAQLREMGINPKKDVRQVVLTHLHCDHADGARFFPNADILIARAEFSRTFGAFPATWPIWFRPTLVDFAPAPHGAFEHSAALTRAGDVLLVPTPGHTYGHMSVIVREDGRDVMLAGDAAFDAGQLAAGEVPGLTADVALARDTLARIRRHVAQVPTVFLPTHDPQAGARLDARLVSP